MSLTVFDVKADYLKRYSHQIKEALKNYTHFGMEGGLTFAQEHEVTEREEFQLTPLLRDLRGKAIRQLGSSGGGNHFVEFGELLLQGENVLGPKAIIWHCCHIPVRADLEQLLPCITAG